jgi:type IV pilus assembly protein PilE
MQKRCGFTLIELMITVAVIATLAAVALPSYVNYVMRGKIIEATTNLGDLRVKMEQFFQDNRTYVGGPCTQPTTGPGAFTPKYFTFSCPAAPTATTYTIQAVGGVTGGDQSLAGFTYTINQDNTKTTTIAAPANTAKWGTGNTGCWIVKPNSC